MHNVPYRLSCENMMSSSKPEVHTVVQAATQQPSHGHCHSKHAQISCNSDKSLYWGREVRLLSSGAVVHGHYLYPSGLGFRVRVKVNARDRCVGLSSYIISLCNGRCYSHNGRVRQRIYAILTMVMCYSQSTDGATSAKKVQTCNLNN